MLYGHRFHCDRRGKLEKRVLCAQVNKQVETMASGKVKFFNTEKGFGFITPDAGGKDVFVHKTGTRDNIQEGDAVTYDVEESPKGLNAVNVQRA